MRDSTYYTTAGLAERIRELRIVRELVTDREAQLILLYDATVQEGSPVDARGRRAAPRAARSRRKLRTGTKLEEVLRASEAEEHQRSLPLSTL